MRTAIPVFPGIKIHVREFRESGNEKGQESRVPRKQEPGNENTIGSTSEFVAQEVTHYQLAEARIRQQLQGLVNE